MQPRKKSNLPLNSLWKTRPKLDSPSDREDSKDLLPSNGEVELLIPQKTPDAPRNKRKFGCLGWLVAFLVLSVLGAIALPPLVSCNPSKAKQTEAKQNVGTMNRAQQAYFLDNNAFANSMTDLGIGIKTQTVNYNYSISATPLVVVNYGIARNDRLKSYVGGVFAVPGDVKTNEILTITLLCEATSPGMTPPSNPIVRGNVIECGSGTNPLNVNEGKPVVVGEDFASFNHSRELTAASRYNQALQVVQSIKHPYFKALALANIAGKYAVMGQHNQALEIAQSIKEKSVKQKALATIARYKS